MTPLPLDPRDMEVSTKKQIPSCNNNDSNIATRGGISWNFTPLFYNSRLSRQIPTPLVYNRTSILGMSTRLQRSQDGQRGPKGRPQGAQGHSKANRSSQKDAQKGGQGLPKEPKGTQSGPRGRQRRSKDTQRNPKEAKGTNVSQKTPDQPPKRTLCYWGATGRILGLHLSGILGVDQNRAGRFWA
jgi:hypothetical protein